MIGIARQTTHTPKLIFHPTWNTDRWANEAEKMFLQAFQFFRVAFGTHPAAVLGDGLTAQTLAVKTLRCPGCSAIRFGCCMIDLSTTAATRAPQENRDNGFWLMAARSIG